VKYSNIKHHQENVERGDHEELLTLKGCYHNLYMSQFRGQMAANFKSWKNGKQGV